MMDFRNTLEKHLILVPCTFLMGSIQVLDKRFLNEKQ